MKKIFFILIFLFIMGYSHCYQDWKGDWYCFDRESYSRCYQDWRGNWHCNSW